MKATYRPYTLNFKIPGGTSRGVLHTKETYFLEVFENDRYGIGECALFRGLSADDLPHYEDQLQWLCNHINEAPEHLKEELRPFPSLWFGYEQAILNLKHSKNLYFPSRFTEGKDAIKINGLIWMGSPDFMKSQIKEKLNVGFRCIKLKIGVRWEEEHQILKNLRNEFPANELELRVDANGAFSPIQAPKVLEQLAQLEIHSIEQPIKAGQADTMAELCQNTPTPIALDEELIGIHSPEDKEKLISHIQPQYIILKPALVGGFSGTDEWIYSAEKQGSDWWITSALESNVGLNAIAQYTYTKQSPLPQGLGTGSLFTNNTKTALHLNGENLSFIVS